jgi:hypothetical protein
MYKVLYMSGYNIAAIQKQLTGIATIIKEKSWTSTSAIDSTLCIHKETLCPGNNVGYITDEVLSGLNGQIKISVDPILYGPSPQSFNSCPTHSCLFPSRVYCLRDYGIRHTYVSQMFVLFSVNMLGIKRRQIWIKFTQIRPNEINGKLKILTQESNL